MFGIIPLSLQAAEFNPTGLQDGYVGGKNLTRFREVTVGCLAVAAQVDTQDFDVFKLMDKASHAVRVSLYSHAPRAGPSPFGKDHEELLVFEKGVALLELPFHVVAVTAPLDGDALDEIAERGQQDIPVEVCPFGKIPDQPAKVQKIPIER